MRIPYVVWVVIAIFSASSCVLAQGTQEDIIKVDTSLVNIPVIVSDRNNRYLPDLAKHNFRVFQDGVEQKIDVFSNDSAPLSIVLALDTSFSTHSVLDNIRKAAKEYIEDLDVNDRAMIVSFDNDVHFLSQLTSDKKQLERAIKNADIGERVGTVLNDALYKAINGTLRNIRGRKAVILLTDGKDHGSTYSQSELLDRLNESDTVIYPIFYDTTRGLKQRSRDRFPGGGRFPGRRGGGMGRFPGGRRGGGGNFPGRGGNRPNREEKNESAIEFLEQLADITGGRFFKEQKTDLKDTFRQIADEMKRQYVVGFYPIQESESGSVHKIKVQVDAPGAVVRSKGAYRTQAK